MHTRERCQICNKISPIGFKVPDDVWRKAIHPKWLHSPLCLSCFIAQADEKLIPWDQCIMFYPVSLFSHLSDVLDLEALEKINSKNEIQYRIHDEFLNSEVNMKERP